MKTNNFLKVILILISVFISQNVFGQSSDEGINMEIYTYVMVGVVLMLITVVFAGLEIFGTGVVAQKIISSGEPLAISPAVAVNHNFDRRISGSLNLGFYFAVMLAIIYFVIILLMLEVL